MALKKHSSAVQSSVDSPQITPLTVTIPQAAQMLNCTVRAVRSLLWAKKIPYLKLGKRFVISTEALRTFVQRSAA